MTIQALHSDVIIRVPDGVYGVILGKLHTDYWRFGCLVGENDCIISPMYQFYWKGSEIPLGKRFITEIPHIVNDIFEIANQIQVIHRHEGNSLQAKVLTENPSPRETYYTLSQRRVKIYTPHFCKFLVTAKGTKHCAGSMTLVTFAKMKSSESGPIANVVAHFCSSLYMYQGHVEVSKRSFVFLFMTLPCETTRNRDNYLVKVLYSFKNSSIYHFMQDILQKENWNGDVEVTQVPLSKDDYNKRTSSLKLSFCAFSEKEKPRWRGYRGADMKKVLCFKVLFITQCY